MAQMIQLVDKDIKSLIIAILHMIFRRKRKGAYVKQGYGTSIKTQLKLDMKNIGEEKIMDGIKNRLYITEERLMSLKT